MIRRYFVVFIPIILLVSIYLYLGDEISTPLDKKLTIYTYSSFASSWGPGPELKILFKQKTNIDVDFIDVGEAGIIIQRILLEKENPKVDLVLGLDQFQTDSNITKELFLELPPRTEQFDEALPLEKIKVGPFVAYNWAPMTFIFRDSDKNNLPQKLEEFASKNFNEKIILFDPRTSSPGFIFFNWIVQRYGEKSAVDFIDRLKKYIHTVTPSWSAGYGLFKKKQSSYVFSYLTSPVYHWIEEKNFDFQPLYMDEGLPYHIEYTAIARSSKNLENSKQFLEFILSSEAQEILLNKNYMLPVVANVSMNKEFKKLKKVKLFTGDQKISREEVLKIWKSIRW